MKLENEDFLAYAKYALKSMDMSSYEKLKEFADINEVSMTNIVEKMDNTASISNTTIYQLCQAILKVDVTAVYMPGGAMKCIEILGILANYGIKGEEAGLHLKSILLLLLAPSEDAKKLMNQLGISEIDANGNLKDFAVFFPELRKVMKKKSKEQQLNILSTLFSTRRLVPAMILCYGIDPEKEVKA
ncbi:MAG: phage tail tape measure protein [Oscillospiraceae bacterium]|nr:phage tail tape measure protein [Oscillospiraceae bacterium]